MTSAAPTAEHLSAAFEVPGPPTLGLEEEVMLLDPETLDLAPGAAELLEVLDGDPRFKLELPASQIEILVPPAGGVVQAADALAAARRRLAEAAAGRVRLAAAGVHPFAAPEGELNRGGRYEDMAARYGPLARRQLVCALQVHVAIRGAERALAVYNALRSRLPEVAALAANAPFYGGRDTGLASVRPLVAQALPRQGLPPPLDSWESWAEDLRWGVASGAVPEPRAWWWELRLNPAFGTLEVRVPDAQSTIVDAAGVAALIHCLAVRLAERHDAGERLAAHATWRIAENRSAAMRRGLDADLADLATGEVAPARERLHRLLDDLGPTAGRLGCGPELARVRDNLEIGHPDRQRAVAAQAGLPGLAAWLADSFLESA